MKMKQFLIPFVLASLLMACESAIDPTAIASLSTHTPKPTFTTSPTFTPLPLSKHNLTPNLIETAEFTPTVTIELIAATPFTPIPWPTPKFPPPTAQLTLPYTVEVRREMQTVVEASERLHQLMKSSEVDNPTWVNQVMMDLNYVYSSYSNLRYAISVPIEKRRFHNMLVDAVRDCYDIRHYIGDPRFPTSEDDLKQIEILMIRCQEQVQQIWDTSRER